jgi:hypothetical protein
VPLKHIELQPGPKPDQESRTELPEERILKNVNSAGIPWLKILCILKYCFLKPPEFEYISHGKVKWVKVYLPVSIKCPNALIGAFGSKRRQLSQVIEFLLLLRYTEERKKM